MFTYNRKAGKSQYPSLNKRKILYLNPVSISKVTKYDTWAAIYPMLVNITSTWFLQHRSVPYTIYAFYHLHHRGSKCEYPQTDHTLICVLRLQYVHSMKAFTTELWQIVCWSCIPPQIVCRDMKHNKDQRLFLELFKLSFTLFKHWSFSELVTTVTSAYHGDLNGVMETVINIPRYCPPLSVRPTQRF
jgi:hypothetical protein